MRLPYDGSYTITQRFGENPASYAKFGLKGHNGLDFGIPNGTPILAPFSGVVKEAYFDPNGYGWYVKIENEKEGTVLAHFMSFNVTIGQQVTEGQLVGLSDNTGNSTGPHLHWGYYTFPRDRANGYNGFIDQYEIIKPLLVADESMTIGKKQFAALITKLDDQDKLIQSLNGKLADKDKECQERLSAQRIDLSNKILEVLKGVS